MSAEKMKRMAALLSKYERREKRNAIYGAARRVVQGRVILLLKAAQMEELRRQV